MLRSCARILLLACAGAALTPQVVLADALTQQAISLGMAPADISAALASGTLPARASVQQLPSPLPDKPAASAPPAAAAPTREAGAYEQQLSGLAGEPLRYFGLDFFRRAQPEGQGLPMADDYLLGPGDSLSVRIWGQLDADLKLQVDASGNLYIPRVGNVAVNGLRFSQLEGALRAAVGRLYRNFDLAVASGDLKTLSITVVGLVERPGVYALSSQGTVFNALAAAGGPADQGSMRQVRLKRRDGRTQLVDLYALLLSGEKVDNYRLQAGDVIQVPRAGPRVAVAGGVVRPGIYELVAGTTLQEAVTMAAGLSRDSDSSHLTLDRLRQGRGREAQATSLDALTTLTVRDGDLLRIGRAPLRYEQSVSLRGHVAFPRQLAWREGLRVSELVGSPELLRTAQFWNSLAGLAKDDEGGRSLDPLDRLSQREDINWDYATIERLDPDTLGTQLLSFNLRRAVIDHAEGDDLMLEPGDVVTLYSSKDIAVPKEKRPRYVRITGEVAEPGVYRVEAGETLPQLIARVGGLTSSAYLYGMRFSREEVRARQSEALKQFVERQEKLMTQATSAQVATALTAEDAARAKQEVELQRAMLQKLKTQQPSGRVVLGLGTSDEDLDDLPALVLEDGDSISIPALPSTVGVQGEVFSPGDFLTQSGRVGYYLARSGGTTESGDLNEAFVLRADGSVVARKQKRWLFGLVNSFGLTRAMPGDTVIVPAKVDRVPFLRNLRDISQVFAQFGLGVAAINNLK